MSNTHASAAPETPPPHALWPQALVGAGVLLTGAALASGAIGISSQAGYSGVGPNFLPWMVSVVLMLCGGWILWEVRTGGFRQMEDAPGPVQTYWAGFIWVSAGLLLNASLITTLGFIVSCTLCYVLAVQGLRRAAGQPGVNRPVTWMWDVITGFFISAPVFWMFTKFLAINLPGLTGTGWI